MLFQATKGVVLATSGYCGNREMMESLNKPAVDHCVAMRFPGPSNLGADIKAALWVGAAEDEQLIVMVFDRGSAPAGTKGGCAYDGLGFMTHIGSRRMAASVQKRRGFGLLWRPTRDAACVLPGRWNSFRPHRLR